MGGFYECWERVVWIHDKGSPSCCLDLLQDPNSVIFTQNSLPCRKICRCGCSAGSGFSILPWLQAILWGTFPPRGSKAGARGGDARLSDNVPAGIHLCRTHPGGSFSRDFSPGNRSCGGRDRRGLWKMMSPRFTPLWSLRNDPKTQRVSSSHASLEASSAQQTFSFLLPLLIPGLWQFRDLKQLRCP